jgi:hypothetical protein
MLLVSVLVLLGSGFGLAQSQSAQCPAGDGRQDCFANTETFTGEWDVAFNGDENPENIRLLGDTLGELYNAWAWKHGSPRVVCEVIPKASVSTSAQAYAINLQCDNCVTDRTDRLFDSVYAYSTPLTDQTALSDPLLLSNEMNVAEECQLPPGFQQKPIFARLFISSANFMLAQNGLELVSISEGDDIYYTGIGSNHSTKVFTVELDPSVPLNEETGLKILEAYNALNKQFCDPEGVVLLELVSFEAIPSTYGTSKGSYTFMASSAYQDVGAVCLSNDPQFREPTHEENFAAFNAELGGKLLNVTFEPIEQVSECDETPENFLSTGDMELTGVETESDMADFTRVFMDTYNSQVTFLCSPGFPEITNLDMTLLEIGRYSYSTSTKCRKSNGCNRRLTRQSSGRRRSLQFSLNGPVGRQLQSAADYDSCVCTSPNASGELPTTDELLAALNTNLEAEGLGITVTDMVDEVFDPDFCGNKKDYVERIVVNTDIESCDEEALGLALIDGFNSQSAHLCDPCFHQIVKLDYVESRNTTTTTTNRRRLTGRYSYDASSRRARNKNRRLYGDAPDRRLKAKSIRTKLEFSPMEEEFFNKCICRSASKNLFVPVSLTDWIQGAMDSLLEQFGCKMQNTTIEIQGYPVPCGAEVEDLNCKIGFEASFASVERIATGRLEPFFGLVYQELQNSMSCDYLNREIGAVNAGDMNETGTVTFGDFNVGFACRGGCDVFPDQPSPFDSNETKLIPCDESEVCTLKPRAPTLDEFVSKWNELRIDAYIPELLSLTPYDGPGECTRCDMVSEKYLSEVSLEMEIDESNLASFSSVLWTHTTHKSRINAVQVFLSCWTWRW